MLTQVQIAEGFEQDLERAIDILIDRAQLTLPNLVEITVIGAVLHSFYTGVENMFLAIAKGVDGRVPSGAQWHRDLLTQMTSTESHRTQVISEDSAHQLAQYLYFRHFFRHAYTFFLDWDKLNNLVTSLPIVWAEVRQQLERFAASLDSPNEP
jgi:hypothetical protein